MKMKKNVKFKPLVAITALIFCFTIVLTGCGTKTDDTEKALSGSEQSVTVNEDYILKNSISINGAKTVTVAKEATFTVASGVKLTIDKDVTFNVDGNLVIKDGASGDIRGKVKIGKNGTYNDENKNADWKWSHTNFSGEIFVDKGGKLTLNETLYVGGQDDDAKISILDGTWAADNKDGYDRFRIDGTKNIYLYNGMFSINDTLTERRTWRLGADTRLLLKADNEIKLVGPTESRKARIESIGARNTEPTSKISKNSIYSWITKKAEIPKTWLKISPFMITGTNGEGKVDLDALLNFGADAGLEQQLYKMTGGDTCVWNGKSGSEGDAYTDEVGVDGKRYSNMRYADRTGVKNTVDLYVPAGFNAGADIPLILFIHGGSWTSGTKDEMASECVRFAKQGYMTATINYRLAGISQAEDAADKGYTTDDDGNMIDMIQDIYDAVTTIKTKVEEFGYRCTKMATSGYSAGGHLSMLYGYKYGDTSPIPVKLVMPQVGPADFHPESWQFASTIINPLGESKTEAQLLEGAAGFCAGMAFMSGKEFQDLSEEEAAAASQALGEKVLAEAKTGNYSPETEALFAQISPASNVGKYKIPTVGMYGGVDTIVAKHQYDTLKNALESNGVDHKLIYTSISSHFMVEDVSATEAFYEQAFAYANKFLKGN